MKKGIIIGGIVAIVAICAIVVTAIVKKRSDYDYDIDDFDEDVID